MIGDIVFMHTVCVFVCVSEYVCVCERLYFDECSWASSESHLATSTIGTCINGVKHWILTNLNSNIIKQKSFYPPEEPSLHSFFRQVTSRWATPASPLRPPSGIKTFIAELNKIMKSLTAWESYHSYQYPTNIKNTENNTNLQNHESSL